MVPTIYSDLRNHTIHTNQYSVTEHFKESNVPMHHNLPGVFFFYDMSPIKVCLSWDAQKSVCGSLLHGFDLVSPDSPGRTHCR